LLYLLFSSLLILNVIKPYAVKVCLQSEFSNEYKSLNRILYSNCGSSQVFSSSKYLAHCSKLACPSWYLARVEIRIGDHHGQLQVVTDESPRYILLNQRLIEFESLCTLESASMSKFRILSGTGCVVGGNVCVQHGMISPYSEHATYGHINSCW
jgi:hypothetical protein